MHHDGCAFAYQVKKKIEKRMNFLKETFTEYENKNCKLCKAAFFTLAHCWSNESIKAKVRSANVKLKKSEAVGLGLKV